MRLEYRSLLVTLGAACWLVACGGRDGGELVDFSGARPATGGTGGTGGKASGGAPMGGSPVVGGGGSTGGVGPGPFPPPNPGPPRPVPPNPGPPMPVPPPIVTRCGEFCNQLAACGNSDQACINSCEGYLSPFGACPDLRRQAVDCYQSVLVGTGCSFREAEQKCSSLLADADRCGPPPPPPPPPPLDGSCEQYCGLAFKCSMTPPDLGYSDCVNSCYGEINRYSPPCRDYSISAFQCRTSVLSQSCDFNAAQQRCSELDTYAYTCQYGSPTPPPPPNPVPPPPLGCLGNVNVPSPGYCEASLSCGNSSFYLYCQPNAFSGTTACSCSQYYQGGFGSGGASSGAAPGYGFEVGYGDCQTAVSICSGSAGVAAPF